MQNQSEFQEQALQLFLEGKDQKDIEKALREAGMKLRDAERLLLQIKNKHLNQWVKTAEELLEAGKQESEVLQQLQAEPACTPKLAENSIKKAKKKVVASLRKVSYKMIQEERANDEEILAKLGGNTVVNQEELQELINTQRERINAPLRTSRTWTQVGLGVSILLLFFLGYRYTQVNHIQQELDSSYYSSSDLGTLIARDQVQQAFGSMRNAFIFLGVSIISLLVNWARIEDKFRKDGEEKDPVIFPTDTTIEIVDEDF